jgi:anthranilate phosphoribosyltransferase
MNAAAALVVGGLVDDLAEGAQRASHAIDSGAAASKLEELARITSS